MNTNKNIARIGGLFYLINIITGIFSQVFVRSSIVVSGDATTTAQNILANEGLFRLGIVSDFIMTTCFLLMGLTFYILLKPVNKNSALLMLLLNLVGFPIMALNLLNQFVPLLLLSGVDYLKVFSLDQLHALVMLFMNMHNYGYIIASLSYTTYLLPLGYLVYKSNFFPRALGILLIIGAFGGLIDLFTQFLLPKYSGVISPIVIMPMAIAEFVFCFWLLIKGAKN